MANRNGMQESLQISEMGVIDLASEDFKMDEPFCIKNDGNEAVQLVVNLWNMAPTEFVTTVFDPGWNPEVVRAIRQNAASMDLKWGS